MALHMKQDVVTDKDGAQVEAEVVSCEHCGGVVWVVFFVGGVEHGHFQCADCRVTYCSGEHCEGDEN